MKKKKEKKDIRIPVVFNDKDNIFTQDDWNELAKVKDFDDFVNFFVKKFNLAEEYTIDTFEVEKCLKILAKTGIPDFNQAMEHATNIAMKIHNFETKQSMSEEEIKLAEEYADVLGMLFYLQRHSQEQTEQLKQHYLDVFRVVNSNA